MCSRLSAHVIAKRLKPWLHGFLSEGPFLIDANACKLGSFPCILLMIASMILYALYQRLLGGHFTGSETHTSTKIKHSSFHHGLFTENSRNVSYTFRMSLCK